MSDLTPETLADLRALLGDKYDDAIERAAEAMDEGYNPDRYSILTAMFRDYAAAALAAVLPVLPDLLAAAWDEGHEAGHEDARAVQSTYPEPTPNPYRTEGDSR